jgi:hypothetical protein
VDHTVCTLKGQQVFLQTVGDWVAECCLGIGSPESQSQSQSQNQNPNQSRPAAGTARAVPAALAAP